MESEPLQHHWRWLALLLICTVKIGGYLSDFPGIFQGVIKETLKINDFEYNMLYSISSLPNIFFPLVGGILIDKLWINNSVIAFSFTIFVSTLLQFYALYTANFYLFLFVWLVYGLGLESLEICCSIMIANHFFGKEYAFAQGFMLAFTRLTVFFIYIYFPMLYWSTQSLIIPIIITASACLLSAICSFWLAYLENLFEQTSIHMSYSKKLAENLGSVFWLLALGITLGYIWYSPF